MRKEGKTGHSRNIFKIITDPSLIPTINATLFPLITEVYPYSQQTSCTIYKADVQPSDVQ
jgi:hypothetical protein